MPDLENSKRNLERATYSPIRSQRVIAGDTGRAWTKWSYFAALAPKINEVDLVSRRLTGGPSPLPESQRQFLDVLRTVAGSDLPDAPSASLPLKMAKQFAAIPVVVLQCFGEELSNVREEQIQATLTSHATILRRYEQSLRKSGGSSQTTGPTLPSKYKLDANFVLPGAAGVKAYRFETKPAVITAGEQRRFAKRVRPASDASGATASASALLVRPPLEEATPATPETTPFQSPP